VISWLVLFVQKTKDDPQSHTNQHQPKHSSLELDPTFEAKLFRVPTLVGYLLSEENAQLKLVL
jgi:hypothetical protein